MPVSCLPVESFLSDVAVYSVDDEGQLHGAVDRGGPGAPIDQVARDSLGSGSAEVITRADNLYSDSSAAIAIPIYRSDRIVSIVVLSARELIDDVDDVVGVFEVWHPVGEYPELALKSGFYGRMERFRNVSSFVRFENGTGLPGQVWQNRAGVIHDDLSNHPGFLRAAGASADLLNTAVGIPVASDVFHGAALLISSNVSPLARGFEVWNATELGFSLVGGAYRGFDTEVEATPGASLAPDQGLPGLASHHGGAVVTEDVDVLLAGRNPDRPRPSSCCGLAIPFYDGDRLSSVTNLLF